MLFLPVATNCRHLCHWCRIPGFNITRNKSLHHIFNCSRTCTTVSSIVTEKTNLPESNDSRADIFGSLQKTSAQHSRLKAKDASKTNNVRVVKLKRTQQFTDDKEANIFGTLSSKSPIWYPEFKENSAIDNDLSDDSEIVRNISKKFKCPKLYLHRMKVLVAEKKLKEALNLFLDMRRNFVSPTHAHYTFMIGACGRVGYTEMAFTLLRQMTDRKFTPTPATLTGLFNSCGESPFPEFGLKKALHLKDKIAAKNWNLTQITYHAMIKAFGKCGDIQTAFQVVDEMAENNIKIDVDTYSFLLMSCIANKDAGFTHAIEVWRKMKERKCKPNIFAFNLLLRAARECDVGPKEISCLLLQHWSSFLTRPYGFDRKEFLPKEKEMLQIEGTNIVDLLPDTSGDYLDSSSVTDDSEPSNKSMPNSSLKKRDMNSIVVNTANEPRSILSERPDGNDEILELENIKTSSDRLAIIGNSEGFLLDMKKNDVKPDIKTFTILLECLPPKIEEEERLLELLDVYKVKPDIGFFNVLIKRRSFRFDHEEAHKVLLLVNKWSLVPDIITYGVLALGCYSQQKATIFVNEMRKLGLSPNTEIVGSLLSGACASVDFDYIENVLKLMEEEGIEPNERMILKLESTTKKIRQNIFDMEQGKSVPKVYVEKGFSRRYKEFCERYEKWLKNVKFDKEEHAWSQYKTNVY